MLGVALGKIQIDKADLISLLNIAQTEDEEWCEAMDQELGRISKKYGYPNVPKPDIEGEYESRFE